MSAPIPEAPAQDTPELPQLPNGHGRIDCSCGAVIHRCDDEDPTHNVAIVTIVRGCPACYGLFGGLPSAITDAIKEATPPEERHDTHRITEGATLAPVEPPAAESVPDAPVEPTDPTMAADQVVTPTI